MFYITIFWTKTCLWIKKRVTIRVETGVFNRHIFMVSCLKLFNKWTTNQRGCFMLLSEIKWRFEGVLHEEHQQRAAVMQVSRNHDVLRNLCFIYLRIWSQVTLFLPDSSVRYETVSLGMTLLSNIPGQTVCSVSDGFRLLFFSSLLSHLFISGLGYDLTCALIGWKFGLRGDVVHHTPW